MGGRGVVDMGHGHGHAETGKRDHKMEMRYYSFFLFSSLKTNEELAMYVRLESE